MKKLVLALLLLNGCQSAMDKEGYAYDPLEGFNRKVYSFNSTADKYVLKPVASGYKTVVPEFARNRVGNFFGNLDDVGSFGNSLLQGEGEQALKILARIINNTFFGLLGLFDVATPMGNEKISADFGQTLHKYGVKSGPYIVLPLLGPSTVRDSAGGLVDGVVSADSAVFRKPAPRIAAIVVDGVNRRSELLGKEELLENSPDPYATMRDAWLQHRWGQLGESINGVEPVIDDDDSASDATDAGAEGQSGEKTK